MSTYYFFKCNKCNVKGGFLSRQMWGWGNFDIVASFKFLGKHLRDCGTEHIGMLSEHDEDYLTAKDDLKGTEGIFPCSNDWKFISENWGIGSGRNREQIDALWMQQERDSCV